MTLTFKEFLDRAVPCECSGYYKDKKKIDPTCVRCTQDKLLLRLCKRVKKAVYFQTLNILNEHSKANGGLYKMPPNITLIKEEGIII